MLSVYCYYCDRCKAVWSRCDVFRQYIARRGFPFVCFPFCKTSSSARIDQTAGGDEYKSRDELLMLSSSSSLKPQDKQLKNCSNPQLPVHTYVSRSRGFYCFDYYYYYYYLYFNATRVCLWRSVGCTCRTAVIRPEAPEALRGAFGRVRRREACTRAVRRGASGPGRIRSCATPVGRRAWTARVRTTRGRVESKYSFVPIVARTGVVSRRCEKSAMQTHVWFSWHPSGTLDIL